MKAKCKECGNEYELGEDEKLEDFQCECGGDLEHAIVTPPTSDKTPKSSEKSSKGIFEMWNQQPTSIKAISIIAVFIMLVVLIIGITGMFSPTQNTTQLPETSTNTSTSPETSQVQAGTVKINDPKIYETRHYKDVYDPAFRMTFGRYDYSSYGFSGELVPSVNFNYLEIIIKYYGDSGTVLGRNTVWTMNSARAEEKYSVRSDQNITGVPAKADIMVFTSPNNNDDSKAIYKKTVTVSKN
jgi:hypothetical protein